MSSAWVMLIVPSPVMSLLPAKMAGIAPSCSFPSMQCRAHLEVGIKSVCFGSFVLCEGAPWALPLACTLVKSAVRHCCWCLLPWDCAQRVWKGHTSLCWMKRQYDVPRGMSHHCWVYFFTFVYQQSPWMLCYTVATALPLGRGACPVPTLIWLCCFSRCDPSTEMPF